MQIKQVSGSEISEKFLLKKNRIFSVYMYSD